MFQKINLYSIAVNVINNDDYDKNNYFYFSINFCLNSTKFIKVSTMFLYVY